MPERAFRVVIGAIGVAIMGGIVVALPIELLVEWRWLAAGDYAMYVCIFFAGVGAALGWLDRLF